MFTLAMTKADGRGLWLYSAREPVRCDGPAPSPPGERGEPRSHLRWQPLRGEWVAYASHRQGRTFLPPAEYDPLAPTAAGGVPTELPAGRYDVAVFENRFPTLTRASPAPPQCHVPTAPGLGACEVVVFTQDATGSLGALPLWHLELVLEVWGERYRALGEHPAIEYVFPFENRGVEVGVTLHHPHGQIYAYPFVPPVAARRSRLEEEHLARHGRGLLEVFLERELAEGIRVLYASDEAAAFVPVCARFPYEVWVAPRRRVPSLAELSAAERRELARALQTALRKYDALWDRPLPYMLVVYQAPTDGAPHPEAHVQVELYPVYRMPGRLKYLAGSETGAGVFTADTLPEATAQELRAVEVRLG